MEEKCVTARHRASEKKLQSGGKHRAQAWSCSASTCLFLLSREQGPGLPPPDPAERSSAFSSGQPAGWACFPGALPEARPGAASRLGPPSRRVCLLIQEMRVAVSTPRVAEASSQSLAWPWRWKMHTLRALVILSPRGGLSAGGTPVPTSR